jgi:hypothetical protein
MFNKNKFKAQIVLAGITAKEFDLSGEINHRCYPVIGHVYAASAFDTKK